MLCFQLITFLHKLQSYETEKEIIIEVDNFWSSQLDRTNCSNGGKICFYFFFWVCLNMVLECLSSQIFYPFFFPLKFKMCLYLKNGWYGFTLASEFTTGMSYLTILYFQQEVYLHQKCKTTLFDRFRNGVGMNKLLYSYEVPLAKQGAVAVE